MKKIQSDDAKIAYGVLSGDVPALYIHGQGLNHTQMRGIVLPGAVLYDLRGHGRSSRGVDISISAHAADAIAVLDELKIDRIPVVGYSIGGAIAQELAAHFPDRVSKLVLINSSPDFLRTVPGGFGAKQQVLYRLLRATFSATNVLGRVLGTTSAAYNPSYADKDSWSSLDALKLYLRASPAWVRENARQSLATQEWRGVALERISVPTLIIDSKHDSLLSSAAGDELEKRLQHAQRVTLAAGHDAIFTKKAEIRARLKEFFSE